ncbi:MAG TPA: PAS domain S-box protein, partial [Pyrinomonadaceae bacterium]|nr:PAS domain S-box protein [Pyrinomonadaceae bacterium]
KSRSQLEELLAREQSARAEAERGREFTRRVLEDAPIAVGVMEGPEHRFVLVNRQTCELTGLSEEQLIGRTHAEVVPEADKVVAPILDRVYTTGLGETQEIEVDLPKGRRQLLVTWTALPGRDGRPGSILYLSLDITARKSAEEALRANEEQFRAVAETAPDAIITIDEESTILFANQSTRKIFGYHREELRGRPLTTLMPEYLRRLHQAGVKRFVETGQRHISWEAVELPGLHKDGHEVPLEISFSEFFTKGKRHFTGVVRDITERKRSQEALRESERQLRILADAVPQLVWMAEPDGHIFWYNQRWYDYTGTSPEQMDGWGWQSVHDPEMLPRVVERWRASLETGEPFEMEFPLKGADGEFRWFLTRVNPLRDSHGRIVRWFGTNTDIDEQRRTAEELREANRLKDEFLATVSHELRTPLTAILGWAQLLRAGQFDEKSATSALETIERNARSQSQLIDDLLDVSRIITGKLRLDVRQVDPASFIESAVEALRPAAEAKNVRIQKVMDTGVVSVAGDPARLQQVVWNLLSNAIKFTPKGGRVQVRLERINSHIEIAISDTGAGIKREFLPHVFERFRQADQRTTRQHGGLGLGLAIVRHLVELHGGTVLAESPGEGQGATFVVNLPIVPVYQKNNLAERVHPAARDTLPSYDCPERLDRLKVLVVDDELDTRELFRVGISQCGAEVVTAGSAREALEAIEEMRPDLLISDIGMPGEDGYELIRKVRALPAERGGKIPAIALTAYARTEDRLRALRAGYQMHVSKPVELAELVAVMASLIQRSNEVE